MKHNFDILKKQLEASSRQYSEQMAAMDTIISTTLQDAKYSAVKKDIQEALATQDTDNLNKLMEKVKAWQ